MSPFQRQSIGKSILDKQALQGWGSKNIDRMAKDLTASFPEISGFSIRNLNYMRKLAEGYPNSHLCKQCLHKMAFQKVLTIVATLKTFLQCEHKAGILDSFLKKPPHGEET